MVDKLLMQIRLGTLMRSGDAANIVWAIFEQEGEKFIKTTDKKGQLIMFNIKGKTLDMIIRYMHRHLELDSGDQKGYRREGLGGRSTTPR